MSSSRITLVGRTLSERRRAPFTNLHEDTLCDFMQLEPSSNHLRTSSKSNFVRLSIQIIIQLIIWQFSVSFWTPIANKKLVNFTNCLNVIIYRQYFFCFALFVGFIGLRLGLGLWLGFTFKFINNIIWTYKKLLYYCSVTS